MLMHKRRFLPLFLISTLLGSLANTYTFLYTHSQKPVQITCKNMPKINKKNSLLDFLYYNRLGKLIRNGLTKKWFSILAGIYCDLSLSKMHIRSFIQAHAIDWTESQKQPHEFRSFNDFFIRTLKPEARPIDLEPLSITSPADSYIIVKETITNTMQFPIKNSNFTLEQFLGDALLAQSFEGGTMFIFRLAPYHYHRFHFPLTCTPLPSKTIHGRYESVNPLVYFSGIQPLTVNERHLYELDTTLCGTVPMVSVGALCVGKIVETYQPTTREHKKGDEGGYFCFGGSTLVLLFKKNTITVNTDILANSLIGQETPIKMGQKIASAIPPENHDA